MKFRITAASIFFLIMSSLAGTAASHEMKPFASNVDLKTGAISVPKDYTKWATLGTWAHANMEGAPGSKEYHVVYTQPSTIDYYKKHGGFPDGAVLVKELINTETMQMTTGPAVSHATTIKAWFVLVRDKKGRYKNSKLWGDGWGWSFFEAPNSNKTVSTDYKENCIACHLPALDLAPAGTPKDDKWIYTLGYPVLQTSK